jgi:hypothetical protein
MSVWLGSGRQSDRQIRLRAVSDQIWVVVPLCHCEAPGRRDAPPEDRLREAIPCGRARPHGIASSRNALLTRKAAGTQDNIKRCPGGSRGPPIGRTSSGSMGPGFPHGTCPWAAGPREGGLRVVSSRAGRPPAGGKLAMTCNFLRRRRPASHAHRIGNRSCLHPDGPFQSSLRSGTAGWLTCTASAEVLKS